MDVMHKAGVALAVLVLLNVVAWQSPPANLNSERYGSSIFGVVAMPSCLASVASMVNQCLPALTRSSDLSTAVDECCQELAITAQSCACTFMAIFAIPAMRRTVSVRLSSRCTMRIVPFEAGCGFINDTSTSAQGLAPTPAPAPLEL